MTTLEKLFVQIFERKKLIIEQVKQQTELYSQHLASKLLVDGITPPSWLWNSNASSNSREVEKEELISKLLCEYSQPAVRFSVTNCPTLYKLAATGDTENISEQVFFDNLHFDQGLNRQDNLTVQEFNRKDSTVCAFNDVPERESIVSSHPDWTSERILNNSNALDPSPTVIQRSNSRQEASKFCNGTKAMGKSGSNHAETNQNRVLFSANQGGKHENLATLTESCVSGSQSCENLSLGNADHNTNESAMDIIPCRVTRYSIQGQCPVPVKDSVTLGCSSKNYKSNFSSHVSKTKLSESNSISDSGYSDDCINQLPILDGSSGVLCQSNGNRDKYKLDNLSTCRVTSPEVSFKSQSCALGVSKSGSDNHRSMIDMTMIDSEKANLPPYHIDGLLICISPNAHSEGCLAQESISEDCKTSREMHIVPSLSSSQNFCVEEVSDLEIHSAQGNVGIIAPSCGRSTQHAKILKERLKSVKSIGLFRRVMKTRIRSNNKETYDAVDYSETSCLEGMPSVPDCQLKSANDEHQNILSSRCMTSCNGTQDVLNEHDQTGFVISSALRLLDQVRQLGRSSCCEQKKQLDFMGAAAPSDSAVSEEPKKIFMKEIGECNIKAIISSSVEYTETEVNCKLSETFQESDIVQSKMVDLSHVQIHPSKLHEEHGLEPLPERHFEEEIQNGEGKDNHRLMLSGSHNEILRSSYYNIFAKQLGGESCVITDKLQQLSVRGPQISCLEGEAQPQHADSSLADINYRSTRCSHCGNSSVSKRCQRSMESWPQLKRKKTEHQQAHMFKARRFHSVKMVPVREHLENMKVNIRIGSMDPFTIDKSTNGETYLEMGSYWEEGSKSSFSSQNGELMQVSKENNVDENSSCIVGADRSGTVHRSSTSKKEAKISQECFGNRMSTPHLVITYYDASKPGDGQNNQHLRNSENVNNIMHKGIQTAKWEGSSRTKHFVVPQYIEDLEHVDVDQSVPLFERFTIDSQEGCDALEFAANVESDKMDRPRNAIERASILAEICRVASLAAPLSQFSSAYEFQSAQNLSESVPNGSLDHLDIGNSLPSNNDVEEQLRSVVTRADDCKDIMEPIPYSDCLAFSGAQYGSSSKNQCTSPVGRLWERLSSYSGSSEKRLSSNPELVCFPIEEYPDSSEMNQSAVVCADEEDVHEEIDSLSATFSGKRPPLRGLANLDLNPHLSSDANPIKVDSLDFVSAKLSVTGAQNNFQFRAQNQLKDESLTRKLQASLIGYIGCGIKRQASSIGSNAIRQAKQSINSSISKSKSNKHSLKGQYQKLLLKEHRGKKINSNLSSFMPFNQNQKAAAICGGKRDVKVKALEAADAAKCFKEKKENERKMKKEALKLEQAKVEEKNLRDKEMQDLMARKRIREEEERKERERKRLRIEMKQHQRELEEKVRTQRAVKEKQQSKVNSMMGKKEVYNETKKQQKCEMAKGDIHSEVSMNYGECGPSRQSCEAAMEMHMADKTPRTEGLKVLNHQGKSYEISPYQCPDDEDEGDGVMATKKYIPSWASKSAVALLLPLQQELNSDVIFPPESFCTMDEVLLPRQ